MIPGLVTRIRFLLLFVILSSSIGHHAAMASDASYDLLESIDHSDPRDPHAHHLADCEDQQCGFVEKSCCVAGQCVLALGPNCAFETLPLPPFAAHSASDAELVPAAMQRLFRPPVV